MKKRDRLGVIFDLLKVISDHNNIKPTPLLRRSNLSSQRFSEYLNEMLKKGFIREALDNKNKKFYTLTDKGFRYLEKYKTILGFIEEFEL